MAVSLAERGGEIQRTAVTNIEPISSTSSWSGRGKV